MYQESLAQFNFRFEFGKSDINPNGNYLLVPLLDLSASNSHGCDIFVQRYDPESPSLQNHAILGQNFFQNYYMEFTNDYSRPWDIDQKATIYVNNLPAQNRSYQYIGNRQLKQGPDPFNGGTTPSKKENYIIGISLAVLFVLIIAVSAICYARHRRIKEEEAKQN